MVSNKSIFSFIAKKAWVIIIIEFIIKKYKINDTNGWFINEWTLKINKINAEYV